MLTEPSDNNDDGTVALSQKVIKSVMIPTIKSDGENNMRGVHSVKKDDIKSSNLGVCRLQECDAECKCCNVVKDPGKSESGGGTSDWQTAEQNANESSIIVVGGINLTDAEKAIAMLPPDFQVLQNLSRESFNIDARIWASSTRSLHPSIPRAMGSPRIGLEW